ncbi:helix-turn-helix transcriptional regulator [Methylophilus sp. 13]|uniref:helix-turn-helix domain-containing protein n=1 Tax=Methylophilus sp. 13 TaxID=2781018 RepID=UPI00188EB3CC|nr:helix-turn-helix transcriptional regulator [Methylophilus sp. 13]
MSPAATLLRHFRINRGYQQKYAAYLLGHDQSYLSGIENGYTSVNWNKFKTKVTSGYQLTDAEIVELDEAIKLSNHKITLPLTMSEENFKVAHELINTVEFLNPVELELFRTNLSLLSQKSQENSMHWISRAALMKLARNSAHRLKTSL